MIRHPDRIALWAVVMAVVGMIAAAASAHGAGGGTSAHGGGTGTAGRCPDTSFGTRALSVGDCGADVKTLNWLLKASSYGVPLSKEFDHPTDNSVRSFQHRHHIHADGVVGQRTRKQIVRTMHKNVATWYDLSGRTTACGVKLRHSTIGVAHRTLPCGTKVTFKYRGHFVRAKVIDRGPYGTGARWDLTKRAADKLHFTSVGKGTVRAATIRR
ncbi:MAG: RlpA-like double-psi beta-barrel domain-containing protein [Solirubrobacterales bacterium]